MFCQACEQNPSFNVYIKKALSARLFRSARQRRGKQQLFTFWAILILFNLPTLAQESEHAIKAAFIEKLTHFIEWPDGAAANDPTTPFHLCVYGKTPVYRALEQLAAVSKIKNKPIRLNKVNNRKSLRGCDMLFISRSVTKNTPSILRLLRGQPILSVGDTPGYGEEGVIVNFLTDRDTVKFEINLKQARTAGFKISARVLKLARIVENDRLAP